MKFSVVVPVYNVERYLPDCLTSLEAQDFTDFEVVLVDDGSTDESLSICREFASRHQANCKLVWHENSGLLATRQRGIGVSSGDYIVSLDGDDCLRGDALSILNQTIEEANQPEVVLFGISRSIDYTGRFNRVPWVGNQLFSRNEMVGVFRALCSSYSMNSMCSKAIRRDIAQKREASKAFGRLSFGEDLLQVMPILDSAQSVYYLDENLYYYRVNQESVSRSFSSRQFDEIALVRTALDKYAVKWENEFGCDDFVSAAHGLDIQASTELIQRACQCEDIDAASDEMKRITGSDFFKTATSDMRAWSYVRADYRLMARFALFASYIPVWLLSRLKGAIAVKRTLA